MGNFRAHAHTHTLVPMATVGWAEQQWVSRQGEFFPVSHNSHLSLVLLCLFPYHISCMLPGGPESETLILLHSLVRSWSSAFILLRTRRPREEGDLCKVAQAVTMRPRLESRMSSPREAVADLSTLGFQSFSSLMLGGSCSLLHTAPAPQWGCQREQ